MSVIFNEAALHRLLEDEAGAVGRMLQRTAEQIQGNYEFVVETIIQNPLVRPTVGVHIEQGDLGLQASIGMPFEDHVSEYLAVKIGELETDHLLPTIMEAWDSQI